MICSTEREGDTKVCVWRREQLDPLSSPPTPGRFLIDSPPEASARHSGPPFESLIQSHGGKNKEILKG